MSVASDHQREAPDEVIVSEIRARASYVSNNTNTLVASKEKLYDQIKPESASSISTNTTGLNTHARCTQQEATQQLSTKFTLFPELPIELRLRIWKHALPNGCDDRRMIKVKAKVNTYNPKAKYLRLTFKFQKGPVEGFVNDLPGRGLQCSCKEARGVFLENYNSALPTFGGSLIRFQHVLIYIAISST